MLTPVKYKLCVSDKRRSVCGGDSDPDWTTSETLQGENSTLFCSLISCYPLFLIIERPASYNYFFFNHIYFSVNYVVSIFSEVPFKYGAHQHHLELFTPNLSSSPQSRAALSLLGFCYYHIQDFGSAAECYEQLSQLHPEVEDYKVYYAQSLYKSGAYPEAVKASFGLDNTGSHTKVLHAHTHAHTESC